VTADVQPTAAVPVAELSRLQEIEAAALEWWDTPRRERTMEQADAARARLGRALGKGE
jgi:hypothetical protein